MASTETVKKNSRKRLYVVAAIIAVLLAAYTAGWLYAAGHIEERAKADLTKLASQGVGVECEDMHVGGYPLRINVVCSSIYWKQPEAGIALQAGSFVSGSPVYAPWLLRNEMSGPAFVEFPGLKPLEINWSKFTSNARLSRPIPTQIELDGRDITIGLRTQTMGSKPIGGLDELSLRLNSSGETLGVNGRFSAFKLSSDLINNKSPEIDGLVDIEIQDAATLLGSSSMPLNQRLRGHHGVIKKAFLSMPTGAMVSVDGPFSVDEEGLINADMKVTLVNPQAFALAGRIVFPEQGSNITTILFALSAMPKDDNGNPIIEITVRKGKANAGFIPLGRLPRL